ncbi:MAG: hypothetical protein ACTS2F_04970 [Thainema sp.]
MSGTSASGTSASPSDSQDNTQAKQVKHWVIWLNIGAVSSILLVTVATFFIYFYKSSGWLKQGEKIGMGQAENCIKDSWQPAILTANSADESLDQTDISFSVTLHESYISIQNLYQKKLLQQQELERLEASLNSLTNNPKRTDAQISELKAEILNRKQAIDSTSEAIAQYDNTLRGIGLPVISMSELKRLENQLEDIHNRIYIHYDIFRFYYSLNQALTVGSALSLLAVSVCLIYTGGVVLKGSDHNHQKLITILICLGGTYIFLFNFPSLLSTEDMYNKSLIQYIGYVNLENEICTVLATEKFVGDPENPDAIQDVDFNRFIHSVESRVKNIGAISVSSNLNAVENFRLDLDSLYPERAEQGELSKN